MAMSDRLRHALQENGGAITSAEAHALGVSNERLRLLTRSGDLERMARGVYVFPGDFPDKMHVLQQRRSRMIYSHETALYLHGLTDRDPLGYTVTVPSGYNAGTILADGLSVFFVKRELHELGAIPMSTTFGHEVMAYDLERTLCDCIRSRKQMDIAVVTDAVKRYARLANRNLNRLMEMADAFHVAKPLRAYLEVLL
jgi:predicted transcriptional regulator of viral defense system